MGMSESSTFRAKQCISRTIDTNPNRWGKFDQCAKRSREDRCDHGVPYLDLLMLGL